MIIAFTKSKIDKILCVYKSTITMSTMQGYFRCLPKLNIKMYTILGFI
jgi:hypothetical protein